MDLRKAGTVAAQAERGTAAAVEHHPVAAQRHNSPDMKGRAECTATWKPDALFTAMYHVFSRHMAIDA